MPRTAVQGGAGKRFPLNMRTTEEVRAKLEEAAAASGRSLAAETEHRLMMSFEWEHAFGEARAVIAKAQETAKAILDAANVQALREAGYKAVITGHGVSHVFDPDNRLGRSGFVSDEQAEAPLSPDAKLEALVEHAVERAFERERAAASGASQRNAA